MKKLTKKLMAMLLVLSMIVSLLPLGTLADDSSTSALSEDGVTLDYGIVHLDCGRKYFSVDSIKAIIDAASEAGMNYVQLAIGNDGMRFLLDDMTLTVDGTTYDSDAVKAAVNAGNVAYCDFDTDELLESEMDEIIAYAKQQGVGIIPLINNPGHMDAILDAGEALTGQTLSYNGSVRTIDVTNDTAKAFTKAFLQLYIDYFSGKGCSCFNLGADEYANDVYKTGGMGFGNLYSSGNYSYFVDYVNDVAALVKAAGMTPMVFNDGIYYESDTAYAFDTDIVIQYWSSGWSGYNVASASFQRAQGHDMINAHGDYYWVLGTTTQCTAETAANFSYTTFQGSTVEDPAGVAFLIWCDVPDYDTEENVVAATVPVIKAFNHPTIAAATWLAETVEKEDEETGVIVSGAGLTDLTVEDLTETASFPVLGYELTAAYDIRPTGITSGTVTLSGLEAGKVLTVFDNAFNKVGTYTVSAEGTLTFDAPHFSVYYLGEAVEVGFDVNVTVEVGVTVKYYDHGGNYEDNVNKDKLDEAIATVTVAGTTVGAQEAIAASTSAQTSLTSGSTVVIGYENGDTKYYLVANGTTLTYTTDPEEATEWTVSNSGSSWYLQYGSYYLRHQNNSLSLSTSTNNATWSYSSNGFYYTSNSSGWGWNETTYYLVGSTSSNAMSLSTSNNNNVFAYTVTPGQEAVEGESVTEVSITGVTPGTTEVTVGAYTYNITVTAKSETVDVALNLGNNLTYTDIYTGDNVTYALVQDGEYVTWDETTHTVTAAALGTAVLTATVKNADNVTLAVYTYNIEVSESVAPDNALTAETLTVEYFITNSPVTDDDGKTSYTLSKDDEGVATADGVRLSALVAASGFDVNDMSVGLWKTVRLDSDHYQTSDGGNDQTANGTTFTYVRYWNGAWQYKDTNGDWNYFLNSDQAVAYYLQHQDITDEISANIKDWGYVLEYEDSQTTQCSDGQVALSFAVVYEDGTVSPAEEDMLLNSTTIFNYWDNRNIGIIVPISNTDYTVSKITYTHSESTTNTYNSYWKGDSTITWKKVEIAEDTTWYDETVVWDASVDETDPVIDGVADDIVWPAKNTAILVLIYVKAAEKEDNLTVRYWDATNAVEIGEYSIAVDPGVLFNSDGTGLQNTADEVPVTDGDYFNLGNAAYIVNVRDVEQTINTDLKTLTLDIAGLYKTGIYQYLDAYLDDDGKTLVIEYRLASGVITDPVYVADFGLPFTFSIYDFLELPDDVENLTLEQYVSENNVKGRVYTPECGYGTLATDDGITFTYTPTDVIQNVDAGSIRIISDTGTTQWAQIGFLPATTVYYEEGFATYGQTWNVTDTGSWTGTTAVSYSTLQQVTKYTKETADDVSYLVALDPDSEHNYGYDPAYAADTGASMGTVASSEAAGDTLQFTFTGEGVDLFANCTAESGVVTVRVTNDLGTNVKLLMINTAYQGDYATDGTATNTPIASISGLEHGTYTVTAYLAKGSFSFDGFRVYNTLKAVNDTADASYKNYKAYASVLEEDPDYYELRDAVLCGLNVAYVTDDSLYASDIAASTYAQVYATATATNGAIVLDSSSETDVQTLLDNGPKNELYLQPGQTVAFKLNTNRQAQIGLRFIGGKGDCTVNGETVSISSVDMFYDLQEKNTEAGTTVYTITNPVDSGLILSVTDIKISDSVEDIFAPLTEEDLTQVFLSLGFEEEPEPFEPSISAKWISRTGYTGSYALLTVTTSTDVESLIVDGQILSCYTFRGQKIWSIAIACGEPGTYTYDIVAVNAEGTASEPIQTPTLTVKRLSISSFFGFKR